MQKSNYSAKFKVQAVLEGLTQVHHNFKQT